MNYKSFCFSLSSLSSVTDAVTSVFTSSWSYTSDVIRDIISTPSLKFGVTPPPTSESSTDFVYVEYNDYDEYSSYEDLTIPSDTRETVPNTRNKTSTSTTATNTNTTTNTGTERLLPETMPPDILDRTTAPTLLPAVVPTVTSEGSLRTSAVPQIPTIKLADPGDIITTTSSPNNTSEGRGLHAQINQTETEASSPLSPSFLTLSKKENNSVDEVSYQIVGLDRDLARGQQNYFVPRLPPFRERTQNKRIQQLLNEKRLQGVLKRSSRSRDGRTDRRHDGL